MIGCVANCNLDLALAGDSLRFDSRLAVPNQDQHTPLGPRILQHDLQESLDQAGQEHFS